MFRQRDDFDKYAFDRYERVQDFQFKSPEFISRPRARSAEAEPNSKDAASREAVHVRKEELVDDPSHNVLEKQIRLGASSRESTFVAVRNVRGGWTSALQLAEGLAVECAQASRKADSVERRTALHEMSYRLEDATFQLRLWGIESDLDDAEAFDHSRGEVFDFLDDALERLEERLHSFKNVLDSNSRSPSADPVMMTKDDEDQDGEKEDAAMRVKSIETQIRAISRTSKMIRESVILRDKEEAQERLATVFRARRFVSEAGMLLGSAEALKKYRVDEKFKGGKALEEARANARDFHAEEQKTNPKVKDYEGFTGVTYLKPSGKEPGRRRSAEMQRRESPSPPARPTLYLEHEDRGPKLEDYVPRRRRTFEKEKVKKKKQQSTHM